MTKKPIEWTNDNRTLVDRVLTAYAADARHVLEIGTGHSTSVLAAAVAPRSGTVWTMDKDGRTFEAATNIVVLTGNSLALPWSRCIDLLYLDGCHKPKHVLKELEKYARWVNPGGWILFDDARCHDVPRLEAVVDAFAKAHGLPWWYGTVEPDGTAVIPVLKRLGEIPLSPVTSSTDCDWCEGA